MSGDRTNRTDGAYGALWALGIVFAALLLVHVPAFLCLPPDNDVVVWDICVREVFAGRVLYRDVFENNLPGMLWWQRLVRASLGWRSEAVRFVDLVVIGLCIVALVRWLPMEASASARLGLAVMLAGFYLSTSEWCHAQRDVWMVLPVLGAVACRARSLTPGAPSSFVRSLLEGLLWGVAVWIKPFILLPGLVCWLVSALSWGRDRRVLTDLAGLLLGGLVAGVTGLLWLYTSGAWADFWDVQLVWNRQYAAHDYTEGNRLLALLGMGVRFFPWSLAHLIAVPIAVGWLVGNSDDAIARQRRLGAALYLGWLAQVVFLQHPWEYLHVPPLLLALTLVGAEAGRVHSAGRALLIGFLAFCFLIRVVPLTIDRAPLVPRCLSEGSTPDLRDRLSLLKRVEWRSLDHVRRYLTAQKVQDGEVSCLTMGSLSLQLHPGMRSATRYIVLQNMLVVFTRKRAEVLDDISASRQRYLIVDVPLTVWKSSPPDERVVFTCGRYRVYAIPASEMSDWVSDHLALP